MLYGGAGSGKSYAIGQYYIYKLLKNKICNLLVVRAVANTNRDSTFALFKQIISKWNIGHLFKINESDMRITCLANNNSIIFKGLDDTEKLKSITFSKGELSDIWVEEASEVEESDFNQLNIRLRGSETNKQIILSFNPVDINSWLKPFSERKEIFLIHSTYKDNKFLDEEYKRQLESYKDTDPYYYEVYCLGNWGVYGKTVFDKEKVYERLNKIKAPSKVGLFNLSDFTECEDGFIKIYIEPEEGRPYVIGGDTAGEGSDYFIGQVLDNITGEQVAVLRQQMDADLYAEQMYELGKYYNNALISIEANYDSFPIKELERLGYTNQYIREREDTFTGRPVKAYGFKTTSITRPIIISELIKIVRENVDLINDKETLEEMLTFIRNEKGRPEAKSGAHDDLIMALAIAHYIRPSQSMSIEKKKEEKEVEKKSTMNKYIHYGI